MNNQLSIITPCYNSATTIEKTILSVINQQLNISFEYIIVDGGSTDHTFSIINKYRQHIHKIISEPDNGAYDAMNKGINHASGNIIGIINADDWYNKNTFSLVAECFQKYPEIDVLYSAIDNYDRGEYVTTFQPGDLESLAFRFTLNHPSCFIKKSAYQKTGLYNINYGIAADYEMIMRLYYSGYKFHYLDTVLAAYSLNGMSSSPNPWHRGRLIYESWNISKQADIYLEKSLLWQRLKIYIIWIVREIFALPIRYVFKPAKARKLKLFLNQFLPVNASKQYGKW